MTEQMTRGEIKVCPQDGEPVVFTMEFPGAEYVCVSCGWQGGIFGPATTPATVVLQDRWGLLVDQYERERAERTGQPVRRKEPAGEPPTCKGCGTTATGPLAGDKPAHWYSRTIDGSTEFACSRDCIKGGMVMPW